MLKPEIIFETENLVAVNKPPGLLTIPDRYDQHLPSLKKFLEKIYGRVWVVHRLDRDTSGLIIFAKDEDTHKYLSQLFEGRNIDKYYVGFVQGILPEKKSIVDVPIAKHSTIKGKMIATKKGKPSITHYEVLEEFKLYSLVQFRIESGRTHQIRAHMGYLGHPVACDEIYGSGKPVLLSSLKRDFRLSKGAEVETPLLKRLALHSWKLQFTDATEKILNLESPMPRDLKALLQQLRKWN